jgi:hypothetical protein
MRVVRNAAWAAVGRIASLAASSSAQPWQHWLVFLAEGPGASDTVLGQDTAAAVAVRDPGDGAPPLCAPCDAVARLEALRIISEEIGRFGAPEARASIGAVANRTAEAVANGIVAGLAVRATLPRDGGGRPDWSAVCGSAGNDGGVGSLASTFHQLCTLSAVTLGHDSAQCYTSPGAAAEVRAGLEAIGSLWSWCDVAGATDHGVTGIGIVLPVLMALPHAPMALVAVEELMTRGGFRDGGAVAACIVGTVRAAVDGCMWCCGCCSCLFIFIFFSLFLFGKFFC